MMSPGKLAAAGLAAALTAMLAIPALAVTAGPAAAASKPGMSVRSWGFNAFGELGDGTTTNSHVPVTAISAGDKFSLARTSKGHALAWGLNIGGQLGSGSTTDSDTPVKVRLPRSARVRALAAGGAHSLASTSGGRLYSWGANDDGQLGDGSTTDSDRPVRLSFPVSGHVTSLFAGCEHSLALLSSGTLLAWGLNGDGQLGDDSDINQDTPVKVLLPAGAKVRAASASCVDSYALTAKGHVLAWGYGGQGQLGDGSDSTSSAVPVRVELPSGWRASAIGAGPAAAHALAIGHRR